MGWVKIDPRRKNKVDPDQISKATIGNEENDDERITKDPHLMMIVQRKSYELNMHVMICVMSTVLCCVSKNKNHDVGN